MDIQSNGALFCEKRIETEKKTSEQLYKRNALMG